MPNSRRQEINIPLIPYHQKRRRYGEDAVSYLRTGGDLFYFFVESIASDEHKNY